MYTIFTTGIFLSLFNTQYKSGDNIWRNTRYNKNYVFNALMGKEFFFKNNKKILDINARVTFTGRERYTPFFELNSIANERIILDEKNALSNSYPDTFYVDLTLNYRINHHKSSSVFSFQMKNIFAAPIYQGYNYNFQIKQVEFTKSTLLIPNISYRIDF
ncbi:hypothetical protein [Capnocytophaga sp.]|uniref:hypothetical protein n=1 Tax=Capnocytophaga sp. TaxID=44737 RepID=UPI0026DC097A|nr:hypothetical protein [Capnocytophaga sp.]MDO5105936.1 hypothetical protein [Capnocytophaga sp.]